MIKVLRSIILYCSKFIGPILRTDKGTYFDKTWHKCSTRIFLFYQSMLKGVKTTLKIGDTNHVLLNISEIIEDTVFV